MYISDGVVRVVIGDKNYCSLADEHATIILQHANPGSGKAPMKK